MAGFNDSGGFGSSGNGGFGQGGSFGGSGNSGFGQGGSFGGSGNSGVSQGGGHYPGMGGNTGTFYGNVNGKSKRFIPSLIITIIYGILWNIPGEILLRCLLNKIWNPLAIAVYVVLFVIPLVVVLLLVSRLAGNVGNTSRFRNTGKEAGLLAAFILLTFAASFLLEFIYELGGDIHDYKPTSYVFVIDDSGSMYGNDPDNLRVAAISEIMKEEDIPYSVYKFSDDAELISEMKNYEDSDSYSFTSDGQYTNILQALLTVSEDIGKAGFQGGDRPKVLLLSDGESEKAGMEEVMKNYTDQKVSVSTVGFGSVNKQLMKGIADLTGGVFINCKDLSTLTEDMHEAIVSSSSRTLLTPRYNVKNNTLYMILRIAFLTAIGALIALCKASGIFNDTEFKRILVYTSAQGLAAGILCEVLANVSDGLARFLVNILWAATLIYHWVADSTFNPGGSGGTSGIGEKKIHGAMKQVGNNNVGNGRSSGGNNSGWEGGNTGNWRNGGTGGNSGGFAGGSW